MPITIELLGSHAEQLQKQFEAASTMMQQTAGALALVRSQIAQLSKEQQEEQLAKEAQEHEQAHHEATQQVAEV